MSEHPDNHGYAAGWCIHYRMRPAKLLANETCEAGVSYNTLGGSAPDVFNRLPCFLQKDGQPKNADAVRCEHLRAPTKEEVAAHEEWIEQRMANMRKVMVGISEWRKKWKGKSHTETVECPVCNGKLRLSISSYNSHVHGKCETPGCVSWME